jgi:hypothetical protein
MKDLNLYEISDRIIDAILSQPFINRYELTKTIRPILSIWVKKCNTPKNMEGYKATIEKLMEDNQIRVDRYKKQINKQNEERTIYREKLIDIIGIDEVKKIDSIIKTTLK